MPDPGSFMVTAGCITTPWRLFFDTSWKQWPTPSIICKSSSTVFRPLFAFQAPGNEALAGHYLEKLLEWNAHFKERRAKHRNDTWRVGAALQWSLRFSGSLPSVCINIFSNLHASLWLLTWCRKGRRSQPHFQKRCVVGWERCGGLLSDGGPGRYGGLWRVQTAGSSWTGQSLSHFG